MKKVLSLVILATALMLTSNSTQAQGKIGYISLNEIIGAMPEARKADTILAQFRDALVQSAQDRQNVLEQDIIKFNADSSKLSAAVKEVRRKNLQQQLQQLQGEDQRIQEELQKRQEELAEPIRKKAMDAVQAVAKEAGYAYVLPKEAVIVAPPGDDLVALVKKKLNLK
ncbi:MAG: OmpH family outer membrane protein [Gemmatimonadaceae bacterium]|nr:OmpH family outer membrane protein [Chitinophagaceae bacterium]